MVRFKSLAFLGYPNYRVGDDGSVCSRYTKSPGTFGPWRKVSPCGSGSRMLLNLINELGQKTFPVHRLVLFAFVGPCPEGMEACHNDGDYSNNTLVNLRWDTHQGNERDKCRHGTSNHGERNGSAKLTEGDVRSLREKYASGAYSMSKLAKEYGITLGTVHPIIHRKTWSHV